ncbi:MAG: hypothetical protein GY861_07810 [bacterium]|nr:hypothetical protein [bacterium]
MDACKKLTALVILLVGVLFLLKDLGVWDFWQINGWTVIFLVVGFAMLTHPHGNCCVPGSKKKK